MLDENIYEQNLRLGLAEPLPWWLEYFGSAKQAGAKPWEMVDPGLCYDGGTIPVRFWHEASLILASARSEVEEIRSRGNKEKL